VALPAVLRGLRRYPLDYLSSLVHRYGSVVRLRLILFDVVVVWQPDHVKHVLQDRHAIYSTQSLDYRVLKRFLGEGLVTSDGELWLRQRRLMQPAFQRTSIAAFASLMVEQTRNLLKDWEGAARDHRPVDVYQEMKRLSLDVVTRALLGVNVHEDTRAAGDAFAVVSEELANHLYSPLFFFFLHPGLPTPSSRRARAALRTLDRIVGRSSPGAARSQPLATTSCRCCCARATRRRTAEEFTIGRSETR
jgi:cytochrome P450